MMNNLFNEEEPKQRRHKNYVRSNSSDGRLHVTIEADAAAKVKKYCELHNLNCSEFVSNFLSDKMEELLHTKYDSMPREELIALLIKADEANNDKH